MKRKEIAKAYADSHLVGEFERSIVFELLADFARTEVNAALDRAVEIARHFANDALTSKEWPDHGLAVRKNRWDIDKKIGLTGDRIASAIEKLKGE